MADKFTEEDFSFFMPVQTVMKSGDKDKEDGKRWIQGIASTNARDLQGEIVVQDGIDFDYFLKKGYFNDDHKDGPEHKVGEPVKCRVTENGLWVKGFLYKKQEKAQQYWDLIRAQEDEPDSNRRVGFSIQGKVLRRKGNTIEKCWIQDIAITTAPINSNTWAEVVKSLSNAQWSVGVDDAEDINKGDLSTAVRNDLPDSAFVFPKERKYPIDTEDRARAALRYGARFESPAGLKKIQDAVKRKYKDIDVGGEDNKDEEAEKALTAAGNGSNTIPESLEDKLKDDRKSPADVSKSLSFEETVSYVETLYGVATAEASSIARVAFDLFGK